MDLSKNRVALRVWGEMACFTRPEMKSERVSYDVMTPSAARGVLEAVYWKPEIRWVIDRIRVLAPIRFTNVRRNEVGSRGPGARSLKAYMTGKKNDPLEQIVEEDRQQRAATILRDVNYLVEAHYEVLNPSEPPQKHYEIFKRRAEKGQCFHRPYMGCREFSASFAWHGGDPPEGHPSLRGERDLGWMLHDIAFGTDRTPRFFRPVMRDGVIEVPALEGSEVHA
jgi:CRISPR-associated protein Cas5d